MPVPALIANAVFLVTLVGFFIHPAWAFQQSHLRHPSHPLSLDVPPAKEIDARVAYEVNKAKLILDDFDPADLLASPYLVSAIYYHDGFLTDFPAERTSADPERRIVAQIGNILAPDRKAEFMRLLHEVWRRSEPAGPTRLVDPVGFTSSSGGRGSHKYAIDLFAAEGTPVHSVSRGLVILADRYWNHDDLFSTTSRKGGNAVIVFDPDEDHFYRYCHLSTVLVSTGQVVASGYSIGAVGHTGLNASLPGHGRHLHFEVNEYVDGHVRAIDYSRLLAMLRQWRS
jgi:murein DD-endopeptidase MepM/ murein hydrolase activator NlpD